MKYGKLILVEELPERYRGGRVGLWLCDCGNTKKLPYGRVLYGKAKSCGCLKRPHGGTGTPEYVAWGAMRGRCAATKGHDFDNYSARGIRVCDRWNDFQSFLTDMGPKPSASHSLGRINNDLGYSPENCRWETPEQQQRNTRTSMIWSVRGQQFPSVREAANHFGVDHKTIRYWVKTKEDCHAVGRY